MGGGELTQQHNIKAHIHGKTDCIVISDCEVFTSLDRVPISKWVEEPD